MAKENINAAFRQLVKVLLSKPGEFRAECASDCEPYCGKKWAVVDAQGGIAYEYDLSQEEAETIAMLLNTNPALEWNDIEEIVKMFSQRVIWSEG